MHILEFHGLNSTTGNYIVPLPGAFWTPQSTTVLLSAIKTLQTDVDAVGKGDRIAH